MQLYLSFEQSAVLNDAGLVPDSDLDTGYVTVSDGDLYDGPGAKEVGTVLQVVGPFPMAYGETAMKQVRCVLRLAGATVIVPE